MRCDRPSLAPMVLMISVSGSSSTPNLRSYRDATAARSLGMPRLDEYRWFRGLRAASASFSTAMSGDGMSGLPNPRSITSSPARRAAILRPSMMVKTYGGRALMRRNSIAAWRLPGGRRRLGEILEHPGVGSDVERRADRPGRASLGQPPQVAGQVGHRPVHQPGTVAVA